MRDFLASRKPSPAMAVAFVALLAALSGTAIALPGTNSVNSGDIVNNTVRGKDIRNGTVAGKDVKDGSVQSPDVGDDSLSGADINESSLGKVPSAANADHATNADNATNATNATTAQNSQQLGGTAASEYLHSFRQVTALSNSDSLSPKSATANCDVGEVAMGGSGAIGGAPAAPENVVVQETQIFQQFTIGFPFTITFPGGFTATGVETDADGGPWTVEARVTCAKG